MAIQLHLKDGSILVGGDFKSALAYVKAIAGFKWNPGEKRWENPAMDTKEARSLFAGFPLDVAGGTGQYHQTVYGNKYSKNEWDAMGAANKAERTARSSFDDKWNALEREATARLDELGVARAHQAAMMSFDFEDNVERGAIQFTSPARRAALFTFNAWYLGEKSRLMDAEDNAGEYAREQVWDRYGDD